MIGDQSLKVKSPGPFQIKELQKYFDDVVEDHLGQIDVVPIIEQVLRTSVKHRSSEKLNKLIPLVKELPMFRDNGLKDNSITEMLSLMTFREA